MAASRNSADPAIEVRDLSKSFTGVNALKGVSLSIYPGEVHCLLGDNGAGKSTLIKVLSGVYRPSAGEMFLDGKPVTFESPRAARQAGIATVHQYGGTMPLMSVGRNFFVGAEPTKGWGPFRRFDSSYANRVSIEEIAAVGLTRVRDGSRLVGSMSGGERQGLAIARALHFGARVLILDEPTSALGVKQAAIVLRLVAHARDQGVAVVFITHNAYHAMSIGDRFAVLIHGEVAAKFQRGEKTREEVLDLMAGGQELEALELDLAAESA
jgi:simple sugar transport system ATP-binding protein